MKKFFLAVFGITFGLVLAFAVIGGSVYWWNEIRTPQPPDITISVDGFSDTRQLENGKQKALLRIIVTNNDDSRISIDDALLYVTRVSDGARANLSFEVNDMMIYPKEKYIEIVETVSAKDDWIDHKKLDEFDSARDYVAHQEKWINQIKQRFNFNLSFVSNELNIRILLDVQAKIADIEDKIGREKDEL